MEKKKAQQPTGCENGKEHSVWSLAHKERAAVVVLQPERTNLPFITPLRGRLTCRAADQPDRKTRPDQTRPDQPNNPKKGKERGGRQADSEEPKERGQADLTAACAKHRILHGFKGHSVPHLRNPDPFKSTTTGINSLNNPYGKDTNSWCTNNAGELTTRRMKGRY